MTWPEGAKKPKTRQLANLAGAGALGGAFWGLLFGLLFLVPLLGAAIGAAAGALAGKLSDVGINDDFIRRTREQVTPGRPRCSCSPPTRSSTGSGGVHRARPELLFTNLSTEQENALREAFAD